uniref:Uncharacterized protein n=1 Tax=Zea mays TaxID=4577 RepID=A0A804NBQ0_MAIZE
MEWVDRTKASAAAAAAAADERAGGAEGLAGYVKVMTDEQMEVLRKQISIYATICEQLVEMHRALTEHQDTIAGELRIIALRRKAEYKWPARLQPRAKESEEETQRKYKETTKKEKARSQPLTTTS